MCIHAPARMLGLNGSGASVSTMYISVTVIKVTVLADVKESAGEASESADAAVKVKPFRGLGSSFMLDSFDWNIPTRLLAMAARYLTFNF